MITRAAVLFVVGVVIAFSAPLHENFGFNRWVLIAAFVLLGLATLLEYYARGRSTVHGLITIRALLMFFAAGSLLLFTSDAADISSTVAIWAGANALVLLVAALRSRESLGRMLPAALLSAALACAVMLLRNDLVGVVGFFGAYTFVCGVFLGISAFDTRATSTTPAQGHTTLEEQESNDPRTEHSQTTTS